MFPTVLDYNERRLLDVRQLTPEYLDNILLPRVDQMVFAAKNGRGKKLAGETMVIAFDKPSFRAEKFAKRAMWLNGGNVISTNDIGQFSDAVPGGLLEDTVYTLMALDPGVIYMRHSETDVVRDAARILTEARSDIVLISAGDGRDGQNPIQALSDWYTIRKSCTTRTGLRMVVTGNLAGNRAVNSIVFMMARESCVEFSFVSPWWGRIDSKIIDHLVKHGVAFQEVSSLAEVIRWADVFYVVNTEGGPPDYTGSEMSCHVTEELVARMQQKAILMHPLPRKGNEIPPSVDKDHRAVYPRLQLECRLWMIMALLLEAFNKK